MLESLWNRLESLYCSQFFFGLSSVSVYCFSPCGMDNGLISWPAPAVLSLWYGLLLVLPVVNVKSPNNNKAENDDGHGPTVTMH